MAGRNLVEQEKFKGLLISIRLNCDLLGTCKFFFDKVEGFFYEILRLKIEIVVARIAYGKSDQKVEKLIDVNLFGFLVDPS